jgi:beta-glucosidase-like glycosyl hydrolase/CubicO group peptidase (beta-lactamase class C family)
MIQQPMKRLAILISLVFFFAEITVAKENPRFLNYSNDQWVDSLMKKLTLDQKIGQLFMVQAYSTRKFQKTDELIKQIKQFQVGGVIFMQGAPSAQSQICNKFQQSSNVPLLIAIDGESGLGFRLDSTINYPVQMALGAITNDSIIHQMGLEIGKQLRRLGIHMNMAPVCDINNNPTNPVINYRSFGEDKMQVAHKSWLYASGLQASGVLATAKHFPGHGDTETDSHFRLPVINQTKNELDSIELYPFSYLINQGIGAVMTGHLQVPALEPNAKIPATLSARIIKNKLQEDLGFEGLIITDAMNMSGAGKISSSELVVRALKAGNDMVEIVPNLEKAIAAVKLAVNSGVITTKDIDLKCRKILAAKKWLGLDHQHLVEPQNIFRDLNKNEFKLTKRLLSEKALTILENRNDILPIQQIDTLKIASLSIGSEEITSFQKMLGNYAPIDHFNISKSPSETEIAKLINLLKPYNLIITGIHGLGLYPARRFGISDQQIQITEKLDKTKTIFAFFGNAYALSYFPQIKNAKGLLIAYQDDNDAEETAAQLVFGATNATGKLPVTVKDMYSLHTGIVTNNIKRLKYTFPEEVKISSEYLGHKIDSIVGLGINKKAFPGCQVLIAKEGKVIYNRSYGFLTYENKVPVQNDVIYDLASVTKVTAPLAAVMKLYDEKKINLDSTYSTYFAEFKNSNKAGLTVRDVLTHQARLQAFIPFYLEPGTKSTIRKGAFKNQPSEQFQVRISKDLYAKNDFEKTVIADIVKSPLNPKKEYVYSDLGMGLFRFVTERLTGKTFPEYLNQEFYKPLGAISTGFKPYERFPIRQIAPTEDDHIFRKELLQGFVHDEMAAVLGSVSGNAGLFSSANDLAKVMQMYLQLGYYGGKQYISQATVEEFTKVQFPQSNNRRALGFDKPSPGIKGQNKFPAADASPESFGHTGFTGTFVWMDPENQMLVVFLSNRVYPSRNHSAISDLNIRPSIHQAIYDAIKHGLSQY